MRSRLLREKKGGICGVVFATLYLCPQDGQEKFNLLIKPILSVTQLAKQGFTLQFTKNPTFSIQRVYNKAHVPQHEDHNTARQRQAEH